MFCPCVLTSLAVVRPAALKALAHRARTASRARPARFGAAGLAAILSLLPGTGAAREKTDVVVLVNGDHFTGEVVGMSRGRLDFKTDDAGRLSIEWLKVSEAQSDHIYEVELSSGKTYLGPLLAPGAPGTLHVGPEAIPIAEVVVITSVDAAFWARVRAYLDLGFTLAKSNSATTLSADGEFAYRGEKLGFSLSFDSYVQDDANSLAVARNSVLLTGTSYFIPWKASVFTGMDQNDELDLQLRLSLGGGAAYAVLRNNWTEILGHGRARRSVREVRRRERHLQPLGLRRRHLGGIPLRHAQARRHR